MRLIRLAKRPGIMATAVALGLAVNGLAAAQEKTAPYRGPLPPVAARVPALMGFTGYVMNGTKTSKSQSFQKPMKDVVIEVGYASYGSGSYTLSMAVKNQSKLASPAMTATATVAGGATMQTLQAQPVAALKAGESVSVTWKFNVPLPETAFTVTAHLK